MCAYKARIEPNLKTINEWGVLYHPLFSDQMEKLSTSAEKTVARGDDGNANLKLFDLVVKHINEIIPEDPTSSQFLQGNSLGRENSAWRRAKFGGRFRLFFRYRSQSRVIAYAWIKHTRTLRKKGAKTDPYTVFEKMLNSGNPPGSFDSLIAQCNSDWKR